MSPRTRAAIALIASVPFAGIGAAVFLSSAPNPFRQIILLLCQFWLLSTPMFWLWHTGERVNIVWPKRSDWVSGGGVGLLMFFIVLAAYTFFLRDRIEVDNIREVVSRVSSLDQASFFLGGFYLIFVNALVEEYFWRWFVFSRCEEVVSSKAAVLLSALLFTAHHTIGLAAFAVGWQTVLVGSLGVFVAGAVWSEIYRRDRAVWSNYVSHAIAVIALQIVAWQVFFG